MPEWFSIVLLTICIACVAVGLGFALWNLGWARGHAAGFNLGLHEGGFRRELLELASRGKVVPTCGKPGPAGLGGEGCLLPAGHEARGLGCCGQHWGPAVAVPATKSTEGGMKNG